MEIVLNYLNRLEINSIEMYICYFVGIISTAYLVYYYLSKEGRDERGRIIFGRSSFISIMTYVVYTNILTLIANYIKIDSAFYQFTTTTTYSILVTVTAVFILFFKRQN